MNDAWCVPNQGSTGSAAAPWYPPANAARQRFMTIGGLAPATGCDAAGALARIDYGATYFFYEPEQGAPHGPPCP